MLLQRRVMMSWSRVGKSLVSVIAHGLLLSFTILLVFKLDHVVFYSWWIIFSPLWLFHGVVARRRFSLPAPSTPHDRHWAPFHAMVATPLLIAFELLVCIHLENNEAINLKIVFIPLLALETSILVDNIRMCREVMPGDEENMNDEAIWETLPHFWVVVSMVFFIAATTFTLLKLSGDLVDLGWWDLFINFSIAECFGFLVCTRWYNPAIHRDSYIREISSSAVSVRYIDWDSGIIVSSDEDQQYIGICSTQEIGGHIMKIPVIGFQILLFMHLEGTPSAARNISFPVLFTPLFLLQGAGVLFSVYRLIEKIVVLLCNDAGRGRYFSISLKAREFLEFLRQGSRLLGWWSIDECSREEQARLYYDGSSGYNTFSPDIVKQMPKTDLAEEIFRLQAALGEQTDITNYSQQEYERLQNDKVLCRVCFDEQINIVLLPCRHHILCSTCGKKCKRCPVCRVSIEEWLPVNDV